MEKSVEVRLCENLAIKIANLELENSRLRIENEILIEELNTKRDTE